MSALDPLFGVLALALFFFVPGYLLVKALWPEKRWRGAGSEGSITAIEMVTGGFVASLGIFLLVGFALGNAGDFEASPSEPLLEGILAAFALVFFLLGWVRGAYRADPPPAPSYVEPPAPGEEDLIPTLKKFQDWGREERRLQREIRRAKREGAGGTELGKLKGQLQDLRDERRAAEAERQRDVDGQG